MAFGGCGGGGGAYAKGTNLNPTFPVSCFISSAGQVSGASSGTNFGATFGSITSGLNVVSAEAGNNPGGTVSQVPGRGGYRFYPTGFAGGDGGTAPLQQGGNGAGGGGAAGPHGAGQVGGNSNPTGPITGAAYGGAADNNNTASVTDNANGNNGVQWDATHGCGSGGGGGHGVKGGNGGRYGGGGGGAGAVSGTAQGSGIGGDGVIIITYTPKAWLPATAVGMFIG